MKTSLADMWLYSVNMVLADPHVLPPVAIGALHQVGLLPRAPVLRLGVVRLQAGDLVKMPNSMCTPSPNSASGPATVCLARAHAARSSTTAAYWAERRSSTRRVSNRASADRSPADHVARTPSMWEPTTSPMRRRARPAGVTRTTVTRPSSVLGSRCTKPSSSSWRIWRPVAAGSISVRRASSPSDSGPSSWMRRSSVRPGAGCARPQRPPGGRGPCDWR